MSVQSQDAFSATITRKVIPFSKRLRRSSLKLVCTDGVAMQRCRHCGGWMEADESEEDCSSQLQASVAR